MKLKDKLIFLDIDGVVNTLMIDTKPFLNSRRNISREGFYFDLCSLEDNRVSNRQAIMWLNKLCKETKAKIVISSTWRLSEREHNTVEKCLRNSGLLDEIEIVGKTPRLNGKTRGDEILKYLEDNYPDGVAAYVILDDDKDMNGCMEALVQCDNNYGFNYPEYIKAFHILNK